MRLFFITYVLFLSCSLILIQEAAAANRSPTIDDIPNYGPILENAGLQLIKLTGIGPGRDEMDQSVSISATSDNEDLIAEVVIQYDQGEKATLFFTPIRNANGKAKITVVLDDGEEKKNIKKESFSVTVLAVNGKPSFQLANDLIVIDENSGQVRISNFAFDIDDGDPEEEQGLRFVTSVLQIDGELSFKSDPEIDQKDGDLIFECNPDVHGEALISVVLDDDGETNNGGIDLSDAVNFTIRLQPADAPPTIDMITDYGPILENAGPQSIPLTGIGPGDESDEQPVSITAVSDNEELISELDIQYDQGETAILSFTPGFNINGSAKITVVLSDGQNTTEETFDVTVIAVNGKPVFELSTDLISIDDNPSKVEIANFAINIDDGDLNEKQGLTFITAVQNISGKLSFLSEPVINQDNGDLVFECKPELYGEAFVSVVLEDDGGTDNGGINVSDSAAFVIRIVRPNSPPTLDDIPSPVTVLEDSGEQLVQLLGLSAGADEENQVLTIDAVSDNTELIDEITIEYEQGTNTAIMKFVSAPNLFGNANITVTVDDGQAINHKISKQFFVVVNPVADTPEVTGAILKGSKQTSSGLVISRNPIDGDEVTNFKISNIQQGNLFYHDGITEIANNTFITFSEGNEGLKFTVSNANIEGAIFDIQAATGPDDDRLGGDVISANIIVDNNPPKIISVPDSIIEVNDSFVYNVKATDSDESDILAFSIAIPPQIQPWLKVIEGDEEGPTIFGTAPQGAEGLYQITVKVEDQVGAFDEQSFNLTVDKQNQNPTVLAFSMEIQEDELIYFVKENFTSMFVDSDGDTLHVIKAANLPEFGSLFLNGNLVDAEVEISADSIQNLVYIPKQDYFGLDVFDWYGSDGQDFALVPKRVSIFISPVNDRPEINDFEEDAIVFEFGDESIAITNTALVYDADDEKLVKAEITISQNYVSGEDSLFYNQMDDLDFEWQDSLGILSINGVATTYTYQEAIRSLRYVNINRLSPSGGDRNVEIVLYDSDTSSIAYLREIHFEDTFVELDIPNAFTPNGDDANDTWSIENIERYDGYEIAVYSRSGSQVFRSTLRQKQWDGTYNGKFVPVGNYFYVIKINKFQKTYTGTVLVLR